MSIFSLSGQFLTWVHPTVVSLTPAACICSITERSHYKSKISLRQWEKVRWDFTKSSKFKHQFSHDSKRFLLYAHFIYIHATQEVNFETDWKLVTIFVGGKDLCEHCLDQVSVLQNQILCKWLHISLCFGTALKTICYIFVQNNLSPKNYSHNLMVSLDMLYAEVRKKIMQVIAIDCLACNWFMFLSSSLSLGTKGVG